MKQKMKRRNGLIILLMIISVFGCKPDPLEFARPESLAGTIYKQLESLGTFSYYLRSLDQTEYKDPLVKGGSWTVFAPTDEAFEKFMQDEGYASYEAIPANRLLHIVQNSIILVGWNTTTLTFYKNQYYAGSSFKRLTQFRDSIQVLDGDDYQHVQDWEPGEYRVDPSYGRYKPTVYFLDDYINAQPVEASDYSFMFPGETYTEGGMKVFEANVSQANIVAENGMIYALDKVLEPRVNQYQNLTSEEYNGKYTLFKRLLERFASFTDLGEVENEEGVAEQLYRLSFQTGITQNLLPFNPYDERYPLLINTVDRTLANGTGLLVPTNEALMDYLDGDNILGQFYDSYDDMPLDVLGKFMSTFFFTHFWTLCPSQEGQTFNVGFDFVDYSVDDAVDVKLCTNGLFVGVDKVYTNTSFSTILGPLLLDPEYTIMLKAVQDLGIDTALQSKGAQFTIFGIKNDQFVNIADPNSATRKITVLVDDPRLPEGYDVNVSDVIYMEVSGDPSSGNNRIYPDPDVSNPSSADIAYVTNTLKDIVLNQVVDVSVDLNSDNFYQTRSGEFIHAYGGDKVAGGGNISQADPAQVVSVEVTENGNFYNMSRPIERPLKFTYGTLVEEANFSRFIEVLDAADALVDILNYSDDKLISFLNLARSFTLLVPNNNAVNQAITDGVIVDPTTLGSLDVLERAIAKQDLLNFAKRHFIQQAIATDGTTTGTFPSLYFSKVIDFVPVYEEYLFENNHATSSLVVKDATSGAVITGTVGITNLFSKKVVIHEVDNYLK